jgi:hypothetical protein
MCWYTSSLHFPFTSSSEDLSHRPVIQSSNRRNLIVTRAPRTRDGEPERNSVDKGILQLLRVSVCKSPLQSRYNNNDKDHQVLFFAPKRQSRNTVPAANSCMQRVKETHHFSAEVSSKNTLRYTITPPIQSMTASIVPYSKIHAAYVSFPELGTCSR